MLADVRLCFSLKDDPPQLPTRDLLELLISLSENPWRTAGWTLNSGRRLGALLHPFKIISHNIYAPGERICKGYKREDFEDAWERYRPPFPTNVSQTFSKRNEFPDNSSETNDSSVLAE
jgi:hypothetical protein